MSAVYLILDDEGVIATFDNEDDAWDAYGSAPNGDVPSWSGDLIVARQLAIRR